MAKHPGAWILVADAARARIFEYRDPSAPLTEISDLVNPEGRQKDSALASDRPGLAFDSGGHRSGHPMRAQRSAHDSSADAFALRIAGTLEEGLNAGGYEKLVLFAPAHFLGQLRGHLQSRVAKAVVESSALELTHETADQIKERLPRLSDLPG